MTRRHGAPRIALVLGAGGVVGHAFEVGVLAALAARTGWEPDRAEVIVGTSAGSAVAALIRAGLGASDHAARSTGEPMSAAGRRLLAALGPPRPVERPSRMPGLRMAAPRMLLDLATRPWDARIGTLAIALLPEGRLVNHGVSGLSRLYGHGLWPDRALWVCAVRLRDGRRVVFGREGAPDCTVADAVTASCAIPGWFAPAVIAGERHVDGGAHSPSNLDVVAGLDLDLVVVLSPMSIDGRIPSTSVDAMLRKGVGLQLARERRRVQAVGTPVVVVAPTPRDLEAMGPLTGAMEPSRRAAVTRRARETTNERLDRPDVQRALAPLYG